MGAYQLGEQALVDAGWVNSDGNFDNNFTGGFTGLFGVHTVSQFLANHAAQDAAVGDVLARTWAQIRANDQEFYGTDTIIQGDWNGDGGADLEIVLSGEVTPLVSDFLF